MFREDEFKSSPGDYEYQNRTGVNEESPTANSPVKVLTAKSIIGDEVESPTGYSLGVVKDIMINMQTGCTEYVVLEFGGFLGIGSKYFAIPFQSFTLDAGRHVFILDRDREYLINAPGFDKGHWPMSNSEHFTTVDNYWNYDRSQRYNTFNNTGGPV
jgi:sporulation protein YlmC with PRC-barrel domain